MAEQTREEATPVQPTAEDGPAKPTELPKESWFAILKRSGKQFSQDNLTDWAAALTYYGVLSIFPGLLVLISLLGLTGQGTTDKVVDNVEGLAPGAVATLFEQAVTNLQESQSEAAGFAAIVGVLAALWSASGYIGAFMRASNAIYDVPEGRPIWKTIPIRIGVTIITGFLVAVSALMVVFTGGLARALGNLVGLGGGFVRVWDIAKWPVIAMMVALLFAILYWASPNAKHGGFRWVSPGGVLAVVIWLIASGLFAFYVANFGSYNKTYGSFAAVIIFLVWLWISNIAILLGAEFDAEMQRGRAIAAGHPADEEPYLELRDSRKIDKGKDEGLG
ncbi:MAG TPA: YihY/virulence factor BrkB family protein [Micromonosporaceae bacterium]|nr:YihY/virulence factor BrkB family protein [Micromonosporaceae bacterium]